MNTETETTRNGSAGQNRAADALSGIVAAACGVAWRSAEEWLNKHGKTATPDSLARAIKTQTKAKINEALRDAREAIAANMPEAAVLTFGASMVQAGIDAAMEASR